MSILGFIIDDMGASNEKMGEGIGAVTAVLLIAAALVWWISKSRRKF